MNSIITKKILAVLFALFCLATLVWSAPLLDNLLASEDIDEEEALVLRGVGEAYGHDASPPFSDCHFGSETRDMCEKCSKIATDPIRAYSTCCRNVPKVRAFCLTFINYTLRETLASTNP